MRSHIQLGYALWKRYCSIRTLALYDRIIWILLSLNLWSILQVCLISVMVAANNVLWVVTGIIEFIKYCLFDELQKEPILEECDLSTQNQFSGQAGNIPVQVPEAPPPAFLV